MEGNKYGPLCTLWGVLSTHSPITAEDRGPRDQSVKWPHPKMAFSSLLEDKSECRNSSPNWPRAMSESRQQASCCLREQCTVAGSGATLLMLHREGGGPCLPDTGTENSAPCAQWLATSIMTALTLVLPFNPHDHLMRSLCPPYSQGLDRSE